MTRAKPIRVPALSRAALILLVAADVLHRAWVAALGPVALAKDALSYWNLGGDVAAGDLLLGRSEQVFRTPGYPWFLGVLRALCGESALEAVVVVQHLLGVATGLLAAWLALRICRSPRAMLFAYLLCAAAPARVLYPNQILTETLFAFLLTASFAAIYLHAELPDARPRAAAAGVLLGLTTLVRPVTQLLPAVLLVPLLCKGARPGSRDSRALVRVGIFGLVLAGFLATLAPWVVRNAQLVGRPALTKAAGRQCWITTFGTTVSASALDLPETPEARFIAAAVAEHGGRTTHHFTVHSALERRRGMSAWAADDLMRRVCAQAIRQHPVAYGRSMLRRIRVFWTATGGREAADTLAGTAQRGARAAVYESLLGTLYRPSPWLALLYSLAAWAGAAALAIRPSHRRFGIFVIGALIYFTLVSTTAAVPLYRYRLPLEPVLAICLATLLELAMQKLRRRAGHSSR